MAYPDIWGVSNDSFFMDKEAPVSPRPPKSRVMTFPKNVYSEGDVYQYRSDARYPMAWDLSQDTNNYYLTWNNANYDKYYMR